MPDQRADFLAAVPLTRAPAAALAADEGSADWAGASTTLWREREALEQLLFKLFEQHLVLAAGSGRWLHLVDDEVHAAAEGVRAAELIRSAEFEVLGRRAGLAPAASLCEFVDAAPEPWPLVFDDHRTVLHELALQVRATAADDMRVLQAGAKAIGATLSSLTDQRSGYDGSAAADVDVADLADLGVKVTTANATYQAALQTTASIGQLSLLDFLR
jgi:hypothetical protein